MSSMPITAAAAGRRRRAARSRPGKTPGRPSPPVGPRTSCQCAARMSTARRSGSGTSTPASPNPPAARPPAHAPAATPPAACWALSGSLCRPPGTGSSTHRPGRQRGPSPPPPALRSVAASTAVSRVQRNPPAVRAGRPAVERQAGSAASRHQRQALLACSTSTRALPRRISPRQQCLRRCRLRRAAAEIYRSELGARSHRPLHGRLHCPHQALRHLTRRRTSAA